MSLSGVIALKLRFFHRIRLLCWSIHSFIHSFIHHLFGTLNMVHEVQVCMLQRRAWRRLSLDAFASDLQMSALCQDLDSLADMSVDAMASMSLF